LTASSIESVLITPIGVFDDDILSAVEKAIPAQFGMTCRIEQLLDDIGFAWNVERRQFHSTAILARLSAMKPPAALKVIALTHKDLFIPILTHVYGEAQLGGACCIVSTYRLADGISRVAQRAVYLERIVKEAAHELGHTLDLRHCRDSRCLMHYCRNIHDVDTKTHRLCRYCQVLLSDHLVKVRRRQSN